MNLDSFIVLDGASLREALALIEENDHGIVLTTDVYGSVVGLATDGDIRRWLLDGGSLDDVISKCANPDFVWADHSTSRESMMKRLDHQIRVIPLLDSHRRLVSIVSRDQLPVSNEGEVYARARAPVRVSFGGGGSDLTHYFQSERGAVINATIAIYSHATLRKRSDGKIYIYSADLRSSLTADNLSVALRTEGEFTLVQALLRTIHPDFGFELYLHSDFPMNSGLGGSSVVAATILGCFNQFRRDKWDSHEIAELAYQAERLYMGVAGGWQDQYATVFGGFNFMEFRMEQNRIHPLRIEPDVLLELEESLVLCDTGLDHNSNDIHEDQKVRMENSDVRSQMKANVNLTDQIRDHLLRGRLLDIGRALDEAWHLKKQFSTKISSTHLDQVYAEAKKNGAVGGKLLGAGGGGFFLFYALPFRKHELVEYLRSTGKVVRPFRFDEDGLTAWTVREQTTNL
jgi:D-glycero-alpha-D-manno-heptose-7-phosphate kinase